jgi:multimeric flavodoxin WrbA
MNKENQPTKVLILLGSPRKKGNSAYLAGMAAKGAIEAGAEVETVYLNGLKISPCQACNVCRKEGHTGCAQNDDMQALYPKVAAADALVIASPVYWFAMSAQTKLFMDRWYMFGCDAYKALAGKRAAVLMTYGDEDAFASGCVNALRSFQDAFRFVGIEFAGYVQGSADGPGEIAQNEALAAKAMELGKKLVC